MTAGVSAAAAVNSSSAAVTSRCASDWVAPASGTCGLAAAWPCLTLAAALISTSTHHTSWIQASQTITDKMRRIAVMSSWLVSADSLGTVCGSGRPTTVISAIGTPTVNATSKMMAPTPASTSPGVRRLIWTGWRRPGIGGAISRPPCVSGAAGQVGRFRRLHVDGAEWVDRDERLHRHLHPHGYVRGALRAGADVAIQHRRRHADSLLVGGNKIAGWARCVAGTRGDGHVAVPERGRVDVVRGGAGGLLGDVGGPGLGHDHLAAVHDQDEQRQRHEREDHYPERHRAAVAGVAEGLMQASAHGQSAPVLAATEGRG